MRIHFIGICGYAVSGLALVAKQLGNEVTGSDEDAYPPTTDILTQAGIKWVDGHAAGNVTRWGKPDLVVQGTQVRDGNPETEAARRHQIRLVSEAEYWGELTADRFRIVVAGSAGKTTTASSIAWILRTAGRNPGFRLGMTARDLGSAAAWGSGREFVFEGDEYTSAVFDPRPKFLHFAPQLAVLTNIDWDHPDVFPDPGRAQRSERPGGARRIRPRGRAGFGRGGGDRPLPGRRPALRGPRSGPRRHPGRRLCAQPGEGARHVAGGAGALSSGARAGLLRAAHLLADA